MSTLQAHEIHPGLIGRRVTFDGPGGSRVSDELTSVVAFADNESVYIRTRFTAPAFLHSQLMTQYHDYWKVPWAASVELGEQMTRGGAAEAKSEGAR